MAGVTVPGTYKRDGNDLNTLKKEFRKVLLGGMPKIDFFKNFNLPRLFCVFASTLRHQLWNSRPTSRP